MTVARWQARSVLIRAIWVRIRLSAQQENTDINIERTWYNKNVRTCIKTTLLYTKVIWLAGLSRANALSQSIYGVGWNVSLFWNFFVRPVFLKKRLPNKHFLTFKRNIFERKKSCSRPFVFFPPDATKQLQRVETITAKRMKNCDAGFPFNNF